MLGIFSISKGTTACSTLKTVQASNDSRECKVMRSPQLQDLYRWTPRSLLNTELVEASVDSALE